MQKLFWLFKMALRDSRKNRSRLFLFISSIILGIAALVAINSFGENLTNEIDKEARNLLGADIEIESRSPINDTLRQFLVEKGLELSEERSFASMVYFPKTEGTRLINVRAVEENYPFYGDVETSPSNVGNRIIEGGKAAVDNTLMLQFDVSLNDSVRIGTKKYVISSAVNKTPGQSAITTTVAPPVFIPISSLEQTGLMKTGSRINYKLYGKFPKGVKYKEFFEEQIKPTLEKYEVRYDDVEERKQELGDAYSDLTSFLNLTAFIALLLGSLGVASSVQVYIKSKVQSVAILRCLGASGTQTIWIYMIQIIAMSFIGSALGVALGVLLQYFLPQIFGDFLPFEIEMQLSLISMVEGMALGIGTAILFALLPLLSIRKVSPLKVIRSSYQEEDKDPWRFVIYFLIIAFVLGFTYLQLGAFIEAIVFTTGILVAMGILAGIGKLITWAIKRFFPSNSAFVVRQGLANLYRPNNQTLLLIITIGLGTALISLLVLTQDLLLNKVKLSSSKNQPNMVLFDIQSDQIEELSQLTVADSLPIIQEVPIITMRLSSIKGIDGNTLKEDTSYHVRDWVVNREYRVTYRDQLIDSEEIASGEFKGEVNDLDSIFISLDQRLADDMQVEIGDRITWNVQGALIPTYVGSFRKIDWQRVQTNFLVVFPRGILEEAPKFHVLLTRYDNVEQSVGFQQKVVKRFPNVSIIDLDLILKTLDEVLSKISFVIQFMAFFSILTGIIVLISSVNISKFQRINEAVLLRTIGASKKQIFRIALMEYFFLGSIAGLTGIFISLISSWLLAYFSFETVFVPNLLVTFLIYLLIVLLTVGIGLFNSRAVVRKPPLVILREEV